MAPVRTVAMVGALGALAALGFVSPTPVAVAEAGGGSRKARKLRRPMPAGAFVLAEGRHQVERRIARAVDRAVADMNVVVRGIARGRLLETNRVIPQVAFESDAKKLVVELGPTRLATFRGQSRRIESEGYDTVLSQRFKRSGVVEQVLEGEKGTRINKFWLRKDGRLAMRTVVSSKHLPAPVVYTVIYERVAKSAAR